MKTISTFLVLWLAITTQAQSIDASIISNSGGTYSNANNSINFSIGETIIGTISNSQSIDQGFWFGIGVQNTLSTEDFSPNDSFISVYPNPATDFLNIKVYDIDTYDISLFDLNGRKIIAAKITAIPQGNQIDISSLSKGIYLLSLSAIENNQENIYRIIKQ